MSCFVLEANLEAENSRILSTQFNLGSPSSLLRSDDSSSVSEGKSPSFSILDSKGSKLSQC